MPVHSPGLIKRTNLSVVATVPSGAVVVVSSGCVVLDEVVVETEEDVSGPIVGAGLAEQLPASSEEARSAVTCLFLTFVLLDMSSVRKVFVEVS